jgi:hypothetical protein
MISVLQGKTLQGMLISKLQGRYSAVGEIDGITVVGEGRSFADAFAAAVEEYEIGAGRVCAFCRGTGEVEVMERVHAGEPHMAPTGTAVCECKLQDTDESDDN